MKLLICIDDTDTLESKGTGAIAGELRVLIEERGFGACGEITRHQLLLHEDVPYTSHNSSMCFDCDASDDCYERLTTELFAYLKAESAPGSDPGLAVANLQQPRLNADALLNYGLDAKRIVLTKEQAYLAARENGVYLAEAGGTGQGVIGALAGVGLRLSGNDGELKGKMKEFEKGSIYTVAQLTASGRIHAVCDPDKRRLSHEERVLVAWKVKPMLMEHKAVLLVRPSGETGLWSTMEKAEMRRYGDLRALSNGCERFTVDAEEEQVDAPARSCLNCRYRRWTSEGFQCAVEPQQAL